MSKKAFTLIELLVAIAIVGILSTFIAIQTNNAANAAKDAKRKADIQLLANAVVSYSSENYSNKPKQIIPCTIGGGTNPCSTTISDSLKPFLATLPSDPNPGAYYYYQSITGNDCSITARLSDGSPWSYDCSTESTTSRTSTNGVCGAAATTYSPDATAFSGSYCQSVTIDDQAFPIQGTSTSWTCPGTYFGSSVTCYAYHGKNGVCGTAVRSTANAYLPTEAFSTNYCSVGTVTPTPTSPAQGGSTSWTCKAIYTGTDASCIAYRGKDGVCGSSNNQSYYNTSEITNPCESGTATVSGSGSPTGYFTWSCPYTYSGTNASCTANLKVNGVCTTGLTYYTTPSSGSCTAGTATSVSGAGPWYWGCNGINSGTSTSSTACSALKKVDGVCGGAATTYAYSATSYGSNTFCSSGTVSSNPSFPDPGTSKTWTCTGLNGGSASGSCTASRLNHPCIAAGGTVYGSFCRFNGSSCPGGWTQYQNWTATTPGHSHTCGNVCLPWPEPSCCSTGSHTFSNIAVETCGYYYLSPMPGQSCYNAWTVAGATVTEVGCYQ